MCGTQRLHLDWWSGTLPGDESFRRHFIAQDYAGIQAVRPLWDGVLADAEAFLEALPGDALARVCRRPTRGGAVREVPLWLSMFHVANHGTQHRSEVAVMLTVLGHSPGDLELV